MNIEGYKDTFFEMIFNLTIKRKALSLSFPTWLHNISFMRS